MKERQEFRNTDLSAEKRAEILLFSLTTEEKIGMLTSNLDANARLGIPPAHFGLEIARGVVQRNQKRETTILPQPWGMAASFDPQLMEQLGNMAGDEVRICNQMQESPGSLVLFGPTVDMERDPRWGRNEEAYGEDPFLTGALTVAYTKGLAGTHEKYLKTAPVLKHFYANNYENERLTTNASIPTRLKREYYLKAFEPAIRTGGAVGVMTAYNCINGVEGVNNPEVTDICKKEWGMPFALSDGGDFGQNVSAHHSYRTHAQSIADILGFGADMMLDSREMVDAAVREALENGLLPMARLNAAVKATLQIRIMLGELDAQENPYHFTDPEKLAGTAHKKLAVKMAEESMVLLENRGLLPLQEDGTCKVAVVGPLANENYTCWYCGYASQQTTVVQGFRKRLGEGRVLFDEGFDHVAILCKKNGKYIRLDEDMRLVADAQGPGQAEIFEKNDWDFGAWLLRSLKSGKYITEGEMQESQKDIHLELPLYCSADEAFGWFVKEWLKADIENGILRLKTWQDHSVALRQDGKLAACADAVQDMSDAFELVVVSSGPQRVAALAREADYTVLCAGNHPLINAREEYDRPDIRLPKAQTALLEAVCRENENTLLYLISGYPFAIARERELAKAVLLSSHLGPCLGDVAVRTIFGENNPAGRTPSTWYSSVRQLPALDDYDIIKNKMTYLYFEGKALYPFGHGKSYTAFQYGQVQGESMVYGENQQVTVTVPVTNIGTADGDEVVQLYSKAPQSYWKRPLKSLKAFSRVFIPKGETTTVVLTVPVQELAVWHPGQNRFLVESGTYEILVGASSEDIRTKMEIMVQGEPLLPVNAQMPVSAVDTENNHLVTFYTDKGDSTPYAEGTGFRSFLVYAGLDTGGGNTFEGQISTPAGSVDVILADDETGAVLGSCTATGTGSRERFTPVVCRVIPRDTPLRLRIIFTKQASLKSFRFFSQ